MPIGAPITLKSRSLLAYLALRTGERIRREVLVTEFWPDAEPSNARNNLKTALSHVRRFFRDAGMEPDAVVVADRDEVRWICSVDIDVREFERCSAAIDGERARALAIYDAELLPGDYSVWATELRARLAAHFEDVLLAELAARPSAEIAERLLLLDPFCNDAYAALIEQKLGAGHKHEALAVYRRYVSALAEIGSTPPATLAERVGAVARIEANVDARFIGRTSELAELCAWLSDPSSSRALIVSGIAGIGKSALVAQALLESDIAETGVLVIDTNERERNGVPDGARAIRCVRPEHLVEARAAFPDAAEIALGPLTRDEVALAHTRSAGIAETSASAEALWAASLGHPLLLAAELTRVARQSHRLESDIARRFEAQLLAAGDDAVSVAELFALEPELDADDLTAILEWSLERVGDAGDRLAAFGIVPQPRPAQFSFPLFAEIAARRFSNGRRHQAIARITQRLALHEHPRTKRRLAQHLMTLGRERDAAAASLEAGRAFATFAAWHNALTAFDEGIVQLEGLATSATAMFTLRELYLGRGDVLNQLGNFPAALRSIDSALDLTDPDREEDVAVRASAYVKAGHAFARINNVESAWMAVRQAEQGAKRTGALATELEAANLASRLLSAAMRYEEAIACASAAYDRAMNAGAFVAASTLAQRVGEPLRRLLRFEECMFWARRQLNAAVLAGPEIEAQAHVAVGAVAYAVNQLDRAAAGCQEGLRLLGLVRRRQMLPMSPFGLTEWNCHQALAHVAVQRGQLDDALSECVWLVRSPWAFNTTACSAMTFATVVDVWLTSNTERDRTAAFAFAERIPRTPIGNPAAFLDLLTRARLAALSGPRSHALELFHTAYAEIVRTEPLMPDQVHISYEKLSAAVRGLDDILAARAAEAGRRHRQIVIDAAGPLWGAV